MMKIAFGMIVFEGDYVLKESLESVYPYASQILIAEGPVTYWQQRGRTTSTDNTNKILKEFPDPENKIKIVHGQFQGKDDQCRAYMKFLNKDTDYIWNLDSDEVYRAEDIEKIISLLEKENYTSVGVRSCSFYGGFGSYIGGFEEQVDNFLRIFKVYPGCTWKTHRPPTIEAPPGVETLPEKHLNSDDLWNKHGVRMYHYSYVFPTQVRNKLEYYKNKVNRYNCHPNYFNEIYLPWVTGDSVTKMNIEKSWRGVHEFIQRDDAYTKCFVGAHPTPIQNSLPQLKKRIKNELEPYLSKQS